MTPSPENNEAGRLLDMEDELATLRAEADKLRAERDYLIELDCLFHTEEREIADLRQQLTNAIDERNIARKESTALAEQLAAAHRLRNEAQAEVLGQCSPIQQRNRDASVTELIQFGKHANLANDALRQRVAELEQALGLARETIRVWHGEIAWPLYQHSPEMKQINAALAATAPDAQSGATP